MKKIIFLMLVTLALSMSALNLTAANLNTIIAWDYADQYNNWSYSGVVDSDGYPRLGRPPLAIVWSWNNNVPSIMFLARQDDSDEQCINWTRITHTNLSAMWQPSDIDKQYNSGNLQFLTSPPPDHFSVACGDSMYCTIEAHQSLESGAFNPVVWFYNGNWTENDSALSNISMGDDVKALVTDDGKYAFLTYTGGEHSVLYSQFGSITGNTITWNDQYNCSTDHVWDFDYALTSNLGTGYGLLYVFKNDTGNEWSYSTTTLTTSQAKTAASSPNISTNKICSTTNFFKMAMSHCGNIAGFVYNKQGTMYCRLASLDWTNTDVVTLSAEQQITEFNTNSIPYFSTGNHNCDWFNCDCSRIHITGDGEHLAMLYVGIDYNMYLLKAYIGQNEQTKQYSLSNISITNLGFTFNNQPIHFDAKFYDYIDTNNIENTKVALIFADNLGDNNVNTSDYILRVNTGTITWTTPAQTNPQPAQSQQNAGN